MSVISYMSPSRVMNILNDNDFQTPNIAYTLINSVCTAGPGTNIEDTTVDFIAAGVQTGDIVYDDTGGRADSVTEVISRTEVKTQYGHVNIGDSYRIFSGINTGGGILLVTGFTSVGVQQVITIGGDTIQVPITELGQVVPVRVNKVFRTTGTTASATYCMLWD